MSDLDAMTPQDARDFYRRWYVPANAAVVVAGDVDPAAGAAPGARSTTAASRRAPCRRASRATEPQQAGMRRMEFKAPADQAYVALAFKVPQLRSFEPTPRQRRRAGADGAGRGARRLQRRAPGPRADAGRRTAWPTASAPATACGAAARSCSRWTACPRRARRPSRWRPRCAPRSRGSRAKASARPSCSRVKTRWIAGEIYKLDSVMSQARELGSYWIQGLPLDADERLIERLRGRHRRAGAGGRGQLLRRRPAHRRHPAAAAASTRTASPRTPAGRRCATEEAATHAIAINMSRRARLAGCSRCWPAAGLLAALPIQHWTQPSGAKVYLVESHGHPDGRRADRLRRRRPARSRRQGGPGQRHRRA